MNDASESGEPPESDDAKVLHSMGYAQELQRRMSMFSNFAISFSIICITAGILPSFQLAYSAGGGASVGIGWVLASLFALVVACSMGQIASAYPTAGGLYHWSSILGGTGWGWATAWFNILGQIFSASSVVVGIYVLLRDLVLGNVFGIDVSGFGPGIQIPIVVAIVLSQALINCFGLGWLARLTHIGAYTILAVSVVLVAALLLTAPAIDISRLWTFTNYTGNAGGGVWPENHNVAVVFILGMLMTIYTMTGFDASAHTSEETVDAQRAVPRGMIIAVLWAGLGGFVLAAAVLVAIANPAEAAKQGGNVFAYVMDKSGMPSVLKAAIYIGIIVCGYLCSLAAMTSMSRMVYAFARDGGLPKLLRQVSPTYRTPIPAVWFAAFFIVASTLYTPAFNVLASGTAVFMYIAYAMPVAAGLLAEGRTWTTLGPFRLGLLSRPFAVITVLGTVVLTWVGVQPPNDALITYGGGLIVLLLVAWFGRERRRFRGPPIGARIQDLQSELVLSERAVK